MGILAQFTGDLDKAAGLFEDCLSYCREAGSRPEQAWVCCDYADLLVQRDFKGDRTRAVSLLDESLSVSTELGMKPLMERVHSRQVALT